MAKKVLPPKSLSKGDTVRFGDMVGVISGDHLSPGGMQEHFDVTFFWGFMGKVAIGRLYVHKDKLVALNVPCPLDFKPDYDGDFSWLENKAGSKLLPYEILKKD